MNTQYDIIVLGTGLKESILAGLLSKMQKNDNDEKNEKVKIFQLDRNNYYGSDSASLNLTNLWKRFHNGEQFPLRYGENRDWNVDLIPKFVMSNGNLVKLLLKTNVSQYLEWKSVEGTFIYKCKKSLNENSFGKIERVPSNSFEAFKSDIMNNLEKKLCKNFFTFVQDYDENDKETYEGYDLNLPFNEIVKKFGLNEETINFIGHTIALYTDNNYLLQPAIDTINRMQLYFNSFGRYGNSPFIYPVWGLSGLAEGFSRLCALYGGTYMLNRDIDDILFDENGKFKGIKSKGQCAYGKILIAEPSYVLNLGKVISRKKVIRSICIMNHPVPNTQDVSSCQIIIPQTEINRKNDIYIVVLNYSNCVCKNGFYLAIISTIIETNEPYQEINIAKSIIGNILEEFITISDIYEPIDTNFEDNIYITSSFDSFIHFQYDIENVLEIYEKITGERYNLEFEEKKEENKEENKDK
jgi:Rab GDP dissociation inhibitor